MQTDQESDASPVSVKRGRFLVLDGIDGCGKSTQAQRLTKRLGALHLREPGSTVVGERLRALVLEPGLDLSARTETLIFAASRAQTLQECVEPALASGQDVVCERFHPSTFSYQAVAGGLPEDEVLGLLKTWAGEPEPDLTLLLHVDLERAHQRRSNNTDDRIEAKGMEFQRKVAEGYLRYEKLDARAQWVNAEGSADEVAERIWQVVKGL